jgi:phosphoribosylformylglycinamidine (FGAM) synthase-like amidotransferase family enzyme
MENKKEYCLIVEGNYLDESDAEDALREPFIDEYVQHTGSFRINNFDEIEVAGGFSIGDFAVEMIDEKVFEITSNDANRPLNEHKAKLIAEALKKQDMFDEIRIEPLE